MNVPLENWEHPADLIVDDDMRRIVKRWMKRLAHSPDQDDQSLVSFIAGLITQKFHLASALSDALHAANRFEERTNGLEQTAETLATALKGESAKLKDMTKARDRLRQRVVVAEADLTSCVSENDRLRDEVRNLKEEVERLKAQLQDRDWDFHPMDP